MFKLSRGAGANSSLKRSQWLQQHLEPRAAVDTSRTGDSRGRTVVRSVGQSLFLVSVPLAMAVVPTVVVVSILHPVKVLIVLMGFAPIIVVELNA